MPKRACNPSLVRASKVHRKSMFLDDPAELVENAHDEGRNESCNQSTTNKMRYNPLNQNNEVERLLTYNSKSLLYQIDHSDFPAFNVGMWSQKNCEPLTYYPTCSFSVPRPVFVANSQCEKIDICYKRPMTRYFFKSRIKTTRTSYQTALKSNRNVRSCVKDNIYHHAIFEMAERVYMQPDPFFQSSYDFYFSGGNLAVLPLGSIIHAGGEKLQEMIVSEFPEAGENADTNSLINVAKFKNSENCEIFEFQPLITSANCSRQKCFATRQLNLISFSCINDENEIKPLTQFRTKSTPFISFAQSERDINNFVITTMKQHVRLYDLSERVPALVNLFEISPKANNVSWNTVKAWRENTFMYANEKQFFMIDIRTTPQQWLKEVSIANRDLICEHISALLPSGFNNLFYVATNHKLQCMDVRHLKKSSLSDSVGGVSRWTHQLRYAPLMIDTFRMRQTEYIALSSPIAGDLHVCQLSRERNDDGICLPSSEAAPKHIYNSPCLPYQPPTLLEAYENARLSGKCLRPEANLEARAKCCITGMKFFKSMSDNGLGMLLTSNSNGDVFAHSLSKREDKDTEERCNKQSDEIMTEFEHKICSQTPQALSYTEIKNMQGLRKVFLCNSLSSVKKFNLDEMADEWNGDTYAANDNATQPPAKSKPNRAHLGRWQKSLSTLHSFKDALVVDLLSIWDIDIEEEHKVRLDNLRHDTTADPAMKVEHWLQENINPDPPMISIPRPPNNTSNVCDTSFSISQTQNTVDFENAVHSTQILHDSLNFSRNLDTSDLIIQVIDGHNTTVLDKSKKKSKKYVKGF